MTPASAGGWSRWIRPYGYSRLLGIFGSGSAFGPGVQGFGGSPYLSSVWGRLSIRACSPDSRLQNPPVASTARSNGQNPRAVRRGSRDDSGHRNRLRASRRWRLRPGGGGVRRHEAEFREVLLACPGFVRVAIGGGGRRTTRSDVRDEGHIAIVSVDTAGQSPGELSCSETVPTHGRREP
jgi:hypothetical protein